MPMQAGHFNGRGGSEWLGCLLVQRGSVAGGIAT
jgi:hypothetical protein